MCHLVFKFFLWDNNLYQYLWEKERKKVNNLKCIKMQIENVKYLYL